MSSTKSNTKSIKTNRYQWPEFVFSARCTSGPLSVFPIVGRNGGASLTDDKTGYMLLSTAIEKGIATITERTDSGTVPVIVVENRGKLPLLGIQGEEYVGAKQNRTFNISVLAPHGRTEIPVTCVEEGRWDRGPGVFGVGAYETLSVRASKAASIGQARRSPAPGCARYYADQGAVWETVSAESALHGVDSPTMAMHDVYASMKVSDPVDKIISGIELPEETIGAVAAIGGRIVAADVFETKDVFAQIWPRIVRSYALSALGSEKDWESEGKRRCKGTSARKTTPPSLEAARSFLTRSNGIPWTAAPSVGLGEDVRWESRDVIASALVWEDRFVHASVLVL